MDLVIIIIDMEVLQLVLCPPLIGDNGDRECSHIVIHADQFPIHVRVFRNEEDAATTAGSKKSPSCRGRITGALSFKILTIGVW